MTNLFRWIGGLFAAIGLVLLIIGGVLLQRDSRFGDAAATAEGRVIEVVRHVDRKSDRSKGVTFTAVIAFTDRSGTQQTFSESISTNPPRFAVGDQPAVLYDPAQPSRAVVDDFWGRKGVATIFSALGAVFALLGLVLLGIDWRSGRKRARLREQGIPITADVLDVFRDTRIKRNGAHPFRVAAQAIDPTTGQLRRFESEAIWVDPTARLAGGKVRVLIDPGNPKSYHVDLPDV